MTEKLYKVLGENGESVNGGNATWYRSGKWMPPIEGKLMQCENGYHLCTRDQIVDWLGPTIWEATYRGERLDCDDKIVVREARITRRLRAWNERTARLFACDCAERALDRLDAPDPRSLNAIAVARRYAEGQATADELAAARYAARDAARYAAGYAARAAARAAARYAARDAARYAARAAARYAARDAARDAERAWQTERLWKYLEAGR